MNGNRTSDASSILLSNEFIHVRILIGGVNVFSHQSTSSFPRKVNEANLGMRDFFLPSPPEGPANFDYLLLHSSV